MIEEQIERLNTNLETIIGLLGAKAQASTTTAPAQAPGQTTPAVTPAVTPAAATPATPAAATPATPPTFTPPPATPPATQGAGEAHLTLQQAQDLLNKEMQRLGKPDQIISLLNNNGFQRLSDVQDPAMFAELVKAAQQLQPEA